MILSIDMGTTTAKAAVFIASGACIDLVSCQYDSVDFYQDSIEIAPMQWAKALLSLTSRIPGKASIRAVVVSGNGPTVSPVFGDPIYEDSLLYAASGNARLWLDRRAVDESEQISRVVDAFVDSSFVLPKILYLYKNDRRLYDKTKWFLSSYEYVNYLLTGEAKAVLHAPDALRWYWDEHMLEQLGLDSKKFPTFCFPGDIVGTVTAQASRALDIPFGIPVFAGGPDFLVSIIGCAAVEPSQVCNRTGTSEGVNLCSKVPFDDDRLMTYLHPIKPYYNISGIISTSGKAIEWVKKLLGFNTMAYSDIYALMARSAPGANNLIFLPYLCGERAPIWDPYAKGVFNGLSLETQPEHLLRSVAEGICFAIRDVLEVMEESRGAIGDIRITGRLAENPFMNQLKADITGHRVLVPEIRDAELVGSMIIAMKALKEFDSLDEAASSLVKIETYLDPNEHLKAMYDDLFVEYHATYENLKASWRASSCMPGIS
ncbi:MAG: FGGY-family carbohydrate kinase [Sphaerochaetaceae bacterium]|nr:FGGY-family carbohydrate kinase [Sphaerochaetaceae bacterium]MDD4259881.1 FGGY-family carbohydrate kinase [Sphaerochaetaceae bacterium]